MKTINKIVAVTSGLVLILVGCANNIERTPVPTQTSRPLAASAPMITKIEMDGSNPRSSGRFNMQFSLKPLVDAPNSTITVTLPSGIALVNGKLTWRGDLRANQEYVHKFVIDIASLTSPNEIRIEALSVPNPGHYWFGKRTSLFLRPISSSTFEISDIPFEDSSTLSPSANVPEPTKDPLAPTAIN
jgi:hypothetical protein